MNEHKKQDFFQAIIGFNNMYKLPMPVHPTMAAERLSAFQGGDSSILGEEFKEGALVCDHYYDGPKEGQLPGDHELDCLTEQADWLGDMIVYCTSELHRYGLNPQVVLGIIMDSNASKLGEDGQPIYDERGKVMKGPGYWKPEPKLRMYIQNAIVDVIMKEPGQVGEVK